MEKLFKKKHNKKFRYKSLKIKTKIIKKLYD